MLVPELVQIEPTDHSSCAGASAQGQFGASAHIARALCQPTCCMRCPARLALHTASGAIPDSAHRLAPRTGASAQEWSSTHRSALDTPLAHGAGWIWYPWVKGETERGNIFLSWCCMWIPLLEYLLDVDQVQQGGEQHCHHRAMGVDAAVTRTPPLKRVLNRTMYSRIQGQSSLRAAPWDPQARWPLA